ncbi:MAG TPA: polysaccharide deacetylase family protein [Steroidobacteraceae bacterium]|jgi:peptidoglycan/xylan/chitin deacetylase (PgdA/CDA1 family)
MFLNSELRGRHLSYGADEYSLTFDDGPSPDVTATLAEYLHAEGVCATFFVLGERATAPALQKIVSLGHRIGNHTFSHQNLDDYKGDHRAEIERQILECHRRIEPYARQGRIPFRAPGGAWSDPRFSRFANELPVAKRYIGRYGWDIDANDWRLLRRVGHPERISLETYCRRFERAIDGFRGGIMLLHDGFPSNEAHLTDPVQNMALEVARFALATMRSRGFRCVPLKEPPYWREYFDRI